MNEEQNETSRDRIERWFGRFDSLVADYARARSIAIRSGTNRNSGFCFDDGSLDSALTNYDDSWGDDYIRRWIN